MRKGGFQVEVAESMRLWGGKASKHPPGNPFPYRLLQEKEIFGFHGKPVLRVKVELRLEEGTGSR